MQPFRCLLLVLLDRFGGCVGLIQKEDFGGQVFSGETGKTINLVKIGRCELKKYKTEMRGILDPKQQVKQGALSPALR